MTDRTKVWGAAMVAFFAWSALAWLLGDVLELTGTELWVVRMVLAFVGLAAAGLLLWFWERRRAAAADDAPLAPGAVGEDVDATFAAARQQLAAARAGGGRTSLDALPTVLVLGADGSAKTTVVTRGVPGAELLAGEVARGDVVVPTAAANVWYAAPAAYVEAGGATVADAGRWARLVRHLRPRQVAAALTGRPAAPRAAVVCMSCEDLVAAGAGEAVPAAARRLRERLAELSRALGVRVPVYVLFTKADRLPYFADFVQNMSRDEAGEVLGATLEADAGPPGQHAERLAARIALAFDELFRSLAGRRPLLLQREAGQERRPGIYEFPREVRKLGGAATEFMVELTRPSQLQVSPYLRGFYFTGVRPEVVTEAAPAAAATAGAGAARASQATHVFAAHGAQPAAAAAAPVTRRVPRWTFLDRVFGDVVLADRAALAATQGGVRVGLLRRVALGAGIVAGLGLAAAFAVSFTNNRALQRDAAAAAAALAAAPSAQVDLPAADALRRLDGVRATLDRLAGYERDGAPLSMRWGLYAGGALAPELRRQYVAAFDKLLLQPARSRMATTLGTLPEAPAAAADYGPTYETLKAYIVTTTHPTQSTAAFLAPVLADRWRAGRAADAERDRLAEQQFAWYADELRGGTNPLPAPADARLVEGGRSYLQKFAGGERIYQFMLAEAGKANPNVSFARQVPGAGAVVSAPYEVPGAFTRGGWRFMQAAFRDVDRFFAGEEWVMGPQRVPAAERARIAAELRARYEGEFVRHWRSYLGAARVGRYGGVGDAAQRLQRLSGPQSPLLALLGLAAYHTGVDGKAVSEVFQPVHAVVAPTDTAKFVTEKNQPYMAALGALQLALEQTASAPPAGADAMAQQAAAAAASAKGAARAIAQGFRPDPEGRVDQAVQRLLEEPIAFAEPMLRNVGAGEMNGKGASFCSVFSRVAGKFPFNPSSPVDATPAEVDAVFRPGAGALWKLYDDVGQRVLVQQGTGYAAMTGGPTPVSSAWVAFFNRAAAVSRALYPENGAAPQVVFSLKPMVAEGTSSVSIVVDGQAARSTRNSLEQVRYSWSPAASRSAELRATLGAAEVTLLARQGPWAIFRLFADADQVGGAGPVYRAEWTLRGRGPQATLPDGSPLKLSAEYQPANGNPLFRRGAFAGLACVSQVARPQ